MTDFIVLSPHLLLAFAAYLMITASPGPSNLVIMSVAMNAGRAAALMLAAGVVTGSMIWGWLAAFGLATLLAQWSEALYAIKLLGGVYLLWLAYKAARSAMKRDASAPHDTLATQTRPLALFIRGSAMHLTNPKAIVGRISIVSIALPAGAAPAQALPIIIGCNVIGIAVFTGYAILFSTATARRMYRAIRRWFDGTVAILFSYAGLRMIFLKLA